MPAHEFLWSQAQIAGALVSPNQGGAANWPPPTFSPATGLFYINASRAFSIYYIFDDSAKPEGWGGNGSHKWETPGIRGGLLSTAGNLVFAGDPNNNLVAPNATIGDPLWHANLGSSVSNGGITYELDNRQYLLVGAGDKMFVFIMNQ